MIFSRSGGYALRAAAYLATRPEGRSASATEIARGCRVAPSYLAKVLQALTRAGLLRSRRGAGGGFALRRDAGRITLADVLRATDDPTRSPLNRCAMGLPHCGDEAPCLIHAEWARARERINASLTRTTLQRFSSDILRWNIRRTRSPILARHLKEVFTS